MKFYKQLSYPGLLIVSVFLWQCSLTKTASNNATDGNSYYSVNDFKTILKYDTHVHLNVYDTTFIHQARADNFRLLAVNVNPAYYPPIEEQRSIAMRLLQVYPDRLAYATTFSLENWDSDDWQQKQLAYLKESFDKGAIAVKVWKNVGMELKDKNGKFVMIDNPKLDPIFDYLAKQHIPLIGHLGEPQNAWLPLEKMTIKGNQSYFSKHPEYHMYLHPEYPSYDAQIQARDNILAKHPGLQFIGAHLGSLEWSTDELAKRLDKFPNMAIDMAARISHLQLQAVTEYEKVRNFFIKYQDRIIYATDLEAGGTINAPELEKRIHDSWLRDWNFLVGDAMLQSTNFEGAFKGLKLPGAVVDKIYRTNAEKWFPGINKNK
ncbi:MAG: amidohydrolase family protein [Segetibacter sp.]|nr:amidohydrolase family protein [Segetibacter sp.]